MNLDELIKRQESLVADMTRSLKARGLDAATLKRAVDVRTARAESIKARIAAVESSKKTFMLQANADIEALKAELAAIEANADRDQAMLKPLIEAAGRDEPVRPRPSGAARAVKRAPPKPRK
jgi:hypothetical protein